MFVQTAREILLMVDYRISIFHVEVISDLVSFIVGSIGEEKLVTSQAQVPVRFRQQSVCLSWTAVCDLLKAFYLPVSLIYPIRKTKSHGETCLALKEEAALTNYYTNLAITLDSDG